MYESLVARVRYHIQKANFMGLKEAESTLLLAEAADAIEELSKRVPKTPHGRLIDADALMKLEVLPSDNWVFRAIEKAPTIIPTEEGE